MVRATHLRRGHHRCFFAIALLFLATFGGSRLGITAGPEDRPLEFNRDIRPILSDKCFRCHGPDARQRAADLRLDVQESALAVRDGRRAVVPGDVSASELVRRIHSSDEDQKMPPPKSGKTLSEHESRLLEAWITSGAKWQQHWSLIPPQRSESPVIHREDWTRNGIDRFVAARLQREGLDPSTEARRETLLRRVTLDLTGLPPTPEEVARFLADEAPGAYERQVDRLLASPRYGERMASRWLDGARYADTSGYQSDGERFMWRWRDWVIDAYNANMPFDQFTIEQLAGDLLPDATLQQRIATGFNRNHRGNAEGGIVPEEYAAEYVADRVETTSTVWMGATLTCARCHDHKFDPFTQRDFYQLFAFFNNVPEKGRAIKYGNSPPFIKSPTDQQQQDLASLQEKLSLAQAEYAQKEPTLAAAQTAWEQQVASGGPRDWSHSDGLEAHLPLAGNLDELCRGESAKFVDGEAAFDFSPLGQAATFDGLKHIDAGDRGDFGFYDKFTLSAWVYPEGDGAIVSRMTDAEEADGYSLRLKNGRLQASFVKRWLDDSLRVETEQPLAQGQWHHVAVSYDGSRLATGVHFYIDGQPALKRVILDELNQTFATKQPLRIGGGDGPGGRFHGRIAEVRVYRRELDGTEASLLSVTSTIDEIAKLAPEQRSAAQREKLRACFLATAVPADVARLRGQVAALIDEQKALEEGFPTTMIMEELPEPRPAHLLARGEYNRPGERVEPGMPASILAGNGGTRNRLDLARWLVHPAHPLTARVQANRFWQMLFGVGLVKTVEDFGSQGEWPSHPELLDFLAVDFLESGWNVKSLLRLMVTSATYRQSSSVSPEGMKLDPENRLLSRGPRYRLSAEAIRDQALSAAGLLVERPGGPSVKPYQPAGLWQELTGTVEYVQDHGESLYRRSLYTFWKRTIPSPSMVTFDAAGRETCIVRETRTNTPLQALTLLNDVTYVEAARVLAERVLAEVPGSGESQIAAAFQRVLGRQPDARELPVLIEGWRTHLARFRQSPDEAEALLLASGEAPRHVGLDPGEVAAMTAITSLMLNLDETVTKE